MTIKITTLSENTAGGIAENLNWFFRAEYALSLLVQVDGLNILFDTGLDTAAVYNARLLGLDLTQINKIVLSHAHEDHTGGLREFLRWSGKTEVIAHPDLWQDKYAKLGKKERYVGIPFRRAELESLGGDFKMVKEPHYINDRILTTGEVPHTTDYEKIDGALFIKEKEELVPDSVADDLSLIIKTDKGLVVILGCAHRGMINHLRHAMELTGESRMYAVIGGTHLEPASEDQLDKSISELKSMKIKKIGACHCTGFKALSRLAAEFPEEFLLINTGTILEL